MEGQSGDCRVVRARKDEKFAVLAARPRGGAGHGRARRAVKHPRQVRVARGAVNYLPAPDVISRQGGESFIIGQGVVRIGALVACHRARQ